MEIFSFLTMAAIALVVSAITEIIKKWKGLAGIGTQALVLVFGLIIALLQYGWTFVPAEQAQTILTILAGAIGWYEVIIKRFESSNPQ
jgi:chromate transport protein ChrA